MPAYDRPTIPSSYPAPSLGIRDSAYCRNSASLYGVEARRFIGRVMSDYLDEVGLTPIELLHCYDHARTLKNAGTQLAGFIQRAVMIQAIPTGQPVEERTRELFSYAEAALMQAKALSKRPDGDPLTVEQLNALCIEEINLRPAHAALSRHLFGAAGWAEKIERVLVLFDGGPGLAATAVLDDLLSEILARTPAIDAILGASFSHEELIGQVLALIRREPPKSALMVQSANCLRLASLFATRNLPACSAVLTA